MCNYKPLTRQTEVLLQGYQPDVWMSWWSPVVLSKQVDGFRHISDTHVTIDDWLQRGELFDSGVDSAGAIRAKQNRVLDHQASVFDRCGGGVADETLMID